MVSMTEGVEKNRWDCTGCGAKYSNFGQLGNHGRNSKTCTPEMRFWGKVNKSAGPDACWPYTGFIKWDGYGWVQHKRKFMTASRFAWIATHGALEKVQHVLHRCDNPPCCNPAHLWIGSHHDNLKDMHDKGRTSKGHRKLGHPALHPNRVRPRRTA